MNTHSETNTTPKGLSLKQKLNLVFDDNLHTKVWQNVVDWFIISLIIISTIEVFLSTFEGVSARLGVWLNVVDIFTTVVFTIEVSLRIWCADLLDPKYKGFKGRVKYCLTFYGLIDFLSTYSFYVALVLPIPYVVLKVLRVLRLFRVFRYMKSFSILGEAVASKRQELGISLAFLSILTVILSFLLYFAEHAAQPDVIENGWKTIVWAFAKYLGDPGNVADIELVTVWGNVIAIIVGVLGIAIFAVPAGLISSGFVEVIEDQRNQQTISENANSIKEAILVHSIRREGIFFPAQNMSFGNLKLDLGLSEDEIFKSIQKSPYLRVKNLSAAILNGPKNDMLVANIFYTNNAYGSHLERGSSVTIVNPLGTADNGLSYFDWHLAQLGGFNYVANEHFSRMKAERDKRCNFYTVGEDTKSNEYFQQFAADILSNRTANDWIVVVAGEQIVKNTESSFHFECGGEKGVEGFDFEGCIVRDRDTLKRLYADFSQTMFDRTQLKCDAHQVQPILNDQNLARYLAARTQANVLVITLSYDLLVFDKRICTAILTMAEVLQNNLERNLPLGLHTVEYKTRPQDSKYWFNLYDVK